MGAPLQAEEGLGSLPDPASLHRITPQRWPPRVWGDTVGAGPEPPPSTFPLWHQ